MKIYMTADNAVPGRPTKRWLIESETGMFEKKMFRVDLLNYGSTSTGHKLIVSLYWFWRKHKSVPPSFSEVTGSEGERSLISNLFLAKRYSNDRREWGMTTI